jgi:exo-beta-1,3-glucanase (GH17 family)
MTSHLSALKTAFSNQGVGLEVRIGETGWPTKGSQSAQPASHLTNPPQPEWYYQAMVNWAASNNVKTILFETYDEPWKGKADSSDSEAYFGIWQANGTAPDTGHYTLNGVTQKYTIG